MTSVFIGGSRRITRLNGAVRKRIDRIIEQDLPVLVGDANGADKAVQRYLHSKGYRNVEVFCSGGRCRNNLGDWPLRAIPVKGRKKGFAFYATKDRAMAEGATYGLMLWDGKSRGTLMNVFRLVRRNKKVVVYESPSKTFLELHGPNDWEELLSRCPDELRRRIEKTAAAEVGEQQASLF